MKRRTLALGIAGALAAALVGIGAVMAQSEEDGNGQSFLDRVAAKLGIGTDELAQAVRDARTDQINEAVAAGDLTQEQADELIEKLDELPAGAPFLGGHFGRGDGPGFGRFGLGHGGGLCAGVGGEELATFLGIDEAQLREELAVDGATLAGVAEAHGKSRDELRSFIMDTAQAKADQAVANGGITQERADAIMARLENNVDELIDNDFPGPRFRFKFDRNGGDDGTEDDGAEEESGILRGFFRS